MKFKIFFLIILTLMITSSSYSTPAQKPPILWNGGFEGRSAVDGKSGGIPNWQPYGEGYVKDSSVHHRGETMHPLQKRKCQTHLWRGAERNI